MALRNDLERDLVHLAQRAHLRETDSSLAVLAARQVALQNGVRGEASQRSDVVEGVAAALAKRPEVAAKRDEHRFGHGGPRRSSSYLHPPGGCDKGRAVIVGEWVESSASPPSSSSSRCLPRRGRRSRNGLRKRNRCRSRRRWCG